MSEPISGEFVSTPDVPDRNTDLQRITRAILALLVVGGFLGLVYLVVLGRGSAGDVAGEQIGGVGVLAGVVLTYYFRERQ